MVIEFHSDLQKCGGTKLDIKDGTVTDLPSITPQDPNWADKSKAFMQDWLRRGKDKALQIKDQVGQTVQALTTFRYKKLTPTATAPTRAHQTDMGVDVYVDSIEVNGELVESVDIKPSFSKGDIQPLTSFKVHTGISLGLPTGYGAKIEDRSSRAIQGLHCLGGQIDNTYVGEIVVIMISLTQNILTLKRGDKIAQLVLQPTPYFPLVEVDDLGETDRGTKGFGSSGA